MLEELREASKTEVETMRRDEAIYEVWPRYVASKEALTNFKPCGLKHNTQEDSLRYWEDGLRLLQMGKEVISHLSGVRVPMLVTTQNFMATCDLYEKNGSLDREFSISDQCFSPKWLNFVKANRFKNDSFLMP